MVEDALAGTSFQSESVSLDSSGGRASLSPPDWLGTPADSADKDSIDELFESPEEQGAVAACKLG